MIGLQIDYIPFGSWKENHIKNGSNPSNAVTFAARLLPGTSWPSIEKSGWLSE